MNCTSAQPPGLMKMRLSTVIRSIRKSTKYTNTTQAKLHGRALIQEVHSS